MQFRINTVVGATVAAAAISLMFAGVATEAGEPTVAIEGAVATILQIEGDTDYGQYLAGECITCHQETGRADGIPAIIGISKDYFVRSVLEYQNNVRDNEVMRLHVKGLGDEEVAALAAYFATLEPQ